MARPSDMTWLALDQGGHASRALLFAADGNVLGEARVPIATHREGDDRVEHDALEILDSLRIAIDRVLDERSDLPPPATAGLATQRSSIVCWHRRTGEPLSPVLSWQDRRAAAQVEALRRHEPQVRRLSGLPLSPHYGATKIRWCVEHLPEVRAAAAGGELLAGPLACFLASRLTGRAAQVDPANASRTQLWDIHRGDWSDELMQLFGIERTWLPAPGATFDDDAGAITGLTTRHRIALAAVTGDQSAVPFAWGAPREDTLFINLGTGAFLQCSTGTRRPDPGRLLASVLYGDARRTLHSLEGTVNGAGSAIDWLATRGNFDVAGAWARWEELPRDVQAAPALHFLNAVSGLGSPWWRGDFASRFVGDDGDTDGDARFAALVASIAYLVRANFDEMRAGTGPIASAIVTGGLARSDGLMQLLADLCGIRLLRPAQTEATALGVLGLLTGSGLAAPATAPTAAPANQPMDEPAGSIFEPDAASAAEAGYRRWRAALELELGLSAPARASPPRADPPSSAS